MMTDGIATSTTTRTTGGTVRGSNGRAIGYGEFGDPDGTPVVLCHGFGDSRLTRYPDDDLTARLGVRLITMDRPGIGLTDPMKGLTILDRTDDIIDLANSLGLNKFAVLGWSGGAPFALAAAGCMPGSVTRVGIAGGFGPFERPGFKRLVPRELRRIMTILKVAPWMSTVMANESSKQLKNGSGGGISDSMMGGADAAILNGAGVRENVTAGAEEAFRQGPAGVAADMLLLFRFKWGFNPEDVQRPVELWYGDDDRVTPVDVGRGLASVLPDARLRVKPGAGHLLYLMYWEEILRTLIEEPAARTVAPGPMPEPAPFVASEPAASAAVAEAAPTEAEPVAAAEAAPSWWETRQHVAAEPEPAVETSEPRLELWRPAPRAATPLAAELERLRAAGFLVAEPEAVVAEPESEVAVEEPAAQAVVAEPEAEAAVAEPEAEAVVAEPEAEAAVEEPAVEAVAVVAEPEAEVAVEEPDAEAVVAEPEEEAAVEEAAVKAVAVVVEVEPEAPDEAPIAADAPAAEVTSEEPAAQITPEEPVAEVVSEEPAAETAEAAAAPVSEEERLRALGYGTYQPEPDVELEPLAPPEAQSDTNGVEPVADTEPEPTPEPAVERELEPVADATEPDIDPAERLVAAGFGLADAPEPAPAPATTRSSGDSTLDRLRAAGFLIPDPEPALEAEAEPIR